MICYFDDTYRFIWGTQQKSQFSFFRHIQILCVRKDQVLCRYSLPLSPLIYWGAASESAYNWASWRRCSSPRQCPPPPSPLKRTDGSGAETAANSLWESAIVESLRWSLGAPERRERQHRPVGHFIRFKPAFDVHKGLRLAEAVTKAEGGRLTRSKGGAWLPRYWREVVELLSLFNRSDCCDCLCFGCLLVQWHVCKV